MAKRDGALDDLALNYKDTKDLVTRCIVAQEPIMIHGKPGIGKSDMIREIGKELGREVIDIRLALLESVDIKGYPFLKDIIKEDSETGKKVEEKALAFAMNEEFPRDPSSTAILFFDEINAAMQTTQLAMYQLILDRSIGPYVLPKGVSMVAAGNREADKGGIFTMPKPLENRFVHVEMQPTFNDWVNWAIVSEMHPEIIGYLAKNEAKLNAFDPASSSRAFPTPRSWAKAGKLLKMNETIGEEALYNLMAGCIGVPVAMEFQQFRKIAHEIPSADEILSGKAPKLKKASIDVAYMLITNVLYKIRELHQQEVNSGKTKEQHITDELAEKVNNFLHYLMANEATNVIGPEFLVLPISIAIKNYKIPLNQKKVTAIKEIMKKTNNILTIALD